MNITVQPHKSKEWGWLARAEGKTAFSDSAEEAAKILAEDMEDLFAGVVVYGGSGELKDTYAIVRER